jgi:hypothetical protein
MQLVQRARSWFRTVLPHEGVVIGAVVLYSLTDLVQLLDGLRGRRLLWGFLPEYNEPGAFLAYLAAVVYGGFRAVYFHPFFRKDYREWLLTTPWDVGRRLPFGPVHLVLQDLLMVGVLTLAAARVPNFSPVNVPLAFLLPYFLLLMLALMNTGQGLVAYAMALTLGGLIRWAGEVHVVAGILVLLYGQALWGLRRSLRSFHEWELRWWKEQGLADLLSSNMTTFAEQAQNKLLGWPFDRLSLKRNSAPMTITTGVCAGLLIAWWLHGGLHHVFRNAAPVPRQFAPAAVSASLAMPCLVLMAVRVGIYVTGYAPPISLLGRLATFRWIIPGYDKVFLAPLFGAAIVLAGPFALSEIGLPWEFGVPLLVGLLITVALSMPPALDEWRLTGHHRVVPAVQFQQQQFVETR